MKEAVITLLCAVTLAHTLDIPVDQNATNCNCDPSEALKICQANFDKNGVLVAHKYCNKFYKCSNGVPHAYDCPSILLYDPVKERCEWPRSVDCRDRIIAGIENGDSENEPDNTSTPISTPDDDNNSSNESEDVTDSSCNCNPNEAPAICASNDSDGILVAHELCNRFYQCYGGIPMDFICPKGLVYNPYKKVCDYANKVECGDRIITDPNDIGNGSSVDNNGDSDKNSSTCNCSPEEAPSICAGPDSSGTLIAHESCNKYYKCDHGKPVQFTCPKYTLYNPYKRNCDWPNNVVCGDRLIPDAEDDEDNNNANTDNEGNNNCTNDNSGHNIACDCNPKDAPASDPTNFRIHIRARGLSHVFANSHSHAKTFCECFVNMNL